MPVISDKLIVYRINFNNIFIGRVFMTVTFFKSLIILVLFVFSSSIIAQQKQKTEANADLIEYTNKEGLPTTRQRQSKKADGVS